MLDFAVDTARQAGALLRAGLERQREVRLKGPFDLVTDVDHASEELIVGAIGRHFPQHAVIAEEGHNIDSASPYTWLIDPIDGTNNYAHGFPYFCVSIALLHEGRLRLGVIYDPLRDELFAAEAGAGATCNGRGIGISQVPRLAGALLATGFPYDYADNPDNNARAFDRVHRVVQGVRRPGAAALDLAYVACGRTDGYWEWGLKPWDSAAGALLVIEAGGRISDQDGQPWTPWSGRMVASNGLIHDELLSVLRGPGGALA